MRKIISFCCVLALLCVSIYLLVLALTNPTFDTMTRTLGIGIVFGGIALVWLWEDFSSPVLKRLKQWLDRLRTEET